MNNNKIYSIGELNYLLENLTPIKETLDYIDYASKSNPLKGSSGAICPFLPKAIALDSIWCSVSKLEEYDVLVMDELIRKNVNIFNSISSNESNKKIFQSLVLIFPNIPTEQVEKLITGIHSIFKRKLVYEGLMIGEFFSENNKNGLYNKEFYPLRSNIPLIAIRYLIPEDLPFLIKESDSVEMRIDFLQGYLQKFEGKLDNIRLKIAKEKLEELKEIRCI